MRNTGSVLCVFFCLPPLSDLAKPISRVPEVKLNPTPFICVGAIEQATRVGSDARNDLRSYLDGIGMH